MTPRFGFLDMDGVIIDFVGGVCRAHGRPNPYLTDPKALGAWDIDKIWNMSVEEFWAPCDKNPKFWDDLEKMPDADEIVDAVCSKFGEENVAILTAPSQDPECVPGKRRSIERHFPRFKNRIIYGKAKKFLGGPGRTLIDDKDSNCAEFAAAGGAFVRVPRLWNSGWSILPDVDLEYIKEELRWIS